jgi:hypothetical protein
MAFGTPAYRSQPMHLLSLDGSHFATVHTIGILLGCTSSLMPTPNWREIILASPDCPEPLVIPQRDSLAEDSECIQDSMCMNEHWEMELWRQPDGHFYYLKVWPIGTILPS